MAPRSHASSDRWGARKRPETLKPAGEVRCRSIALRSAPGFDTDELCRADRLRRRIERRRVRVLRRRDSHDVFAGQDVEVIAACPVDLRRATSDKPIAADDGHPAQRGDGGASVGEAVRAGDVPADRSVPPETQRQVGDVFSPVKVEDDPAVVRRRTRPVVGARVAVESTHSARSHPGPDDCRPNRPSGVVAKPQGPERGPARCAKIIASTGRTGRWRRQRSRPDRDAARRIVNRRLSWRLRRGQSAAKDENRKRRRMPSEHV